MRRRRICAVTGSRADYGLLYWPMRLIAEAEEFELQVVATGMHLSPAFGETWRQIREDGFPIDAKVEMLLSGDTGVAIAKSVGLGIIGFADALEKLQPDLMLILGDRFEILAAAQAALFAKVPVAHLCGGDVTEGAFDESIRHAITKMSHLHFPTNAGAAARLIAMGENPDHIHVVGSSGLDRIRRMPFMRREDFFDAIGLAPRSHNLMVALHPTTLESSSALDQAEELITSLDSLGPDVGLLITGANADTEGQRLNERLKAFADARTNAVFRTSLGSELFLNAMRQVDAVVGNSSSGLYEAPWFGTPAVNIGDRQKGRLRAKSVFDSPFDSRSIAAAIKQALACGRFPQDNLYGSGYAAEDIVAQLKQIDDFKALVRKPFYENAVRI